MKSNQITDMNEVENYTHLKVMKSRAGFYVGSVYIDPVDHYPCPGTRDSEYFRTAEEAQRYLNGMLEAEGLVNQ